MSKITRTVLKTDKQIFDVTIEDKIEKFHSNIFGKTIKHFKYITVSVGPETSSKVYSDQGELVEYFGSQVLRLKIESDTNISLLLRDWRDLMELLPTAIMEHNL